MYEILVYDRLAAVFSSWKGNTLCSVGNTVKFFSLWLDCGLWQIVAPVKIGNYELISLNILCLNDSGKRNHGVSKICRYLLYEIRQVGSSCDVVKLWKICFNQTLFLGRGCILPMQRDIFKFPSRNPLYITP